MPGQHMENLFRRFKGERINVKTISGGIYEGRVIEIANNYVCLTETAGADSQPVFISFTAIESMTSTVPAE
jgi:hypothetical protein